MANPANDPAKLRETIDAIVTRSRTEQNSADSNLGILETLLTPSAAKYMSGLKHITEVYLHTLGLPLSAIRSAKPEHIARAVMIPRYRNTWRERVNPEFGLLGETDSEWQDTLASANSANASASGDLAALQARARESARESANATASDNSANANAANARTPIIDLRAIQAAVQTALAPHLSDANAHDTALRAKFAALETRLLPLIAQHASATAETIARRTIAELSAPREIIVKNASTGTAISAGLQHERFPALLRALSARDHRGYRLNVWLTGPTGSGKTSACEAAAKVLGLTFGSDGSLDADFKVLGFRDANGNIVSTQFLQIYEFGGLYVADEIDNWLPSALLSLNAANANGFVSTPKGIIRRHKDACIIACANTWGHGATNEYVGRAKQDAASLDRFHPKMDWPIDEKLEAAIALSHGGAIGTAWHKVVKISRQRVRDQGLRIIISPRATISGISLLAQDFTPEEVADMTFAAGLSPDQRRAIINVATLETCESEIADAFANARAVTTANVDDCFGDETVDAEAA